MVFYYPNGSLVSQTASDPFFGGITTVSVVQAYLDTGTSGILLSRDTSDALGINYNTSVTFNDIGLGGSSAYYVSSPYYVATAPYSEDSDQNELSAGPPAPDPLQTNNAPYTNVIQPVNFEVSQTYVDPDDLFAQPIDIAGMPLMHGKVTVFDLRGPNALDIDNLTETRTYIYAPGTPYNPTQIDPPAGDITGVGNPGIVPTQLHVKLSFGSFAQFTTISPANATMPVLNDNPFIGPNPVNKLLANPPVDNTPPITITYSGHTSTGSFLFDTGAAASFISTAEAQAMGVYVGTLGNGDPYLYTNPADPTGSKITNQFLAPLVGASGEAVDIAGFYLDSLSIPTVEGDPIRFLGAPVLVQDITVENGLGQTLTLDGDLGMNFFEASYLVDLDGNILADSDGAFDWMTLDEPNGLLGLTFSSLVPEPSGALMFVIPALFLLARRRTNTPVRA
jgi:hypothetical protein